MKHMLPFVIFGLWSMLVGGLIHRYPKLFYKRRIGSTKPQPKWAVTYNRYFGAVLFVVGVGVIAAGVVSQVM